MKTPTFESIGKKKVAGAMSVLVALGLGVVAMHGMNKGVILAEDATSDDISAIPKCAEATDGTRHAIIDLIRKHAPEGEYTDGAVSVVELIGSATSLPSAAEGIGDLVDAFDYFEEHKNDLENISLMKPHESAEKLNEANHKLKKAIGALEGIKKAGLCFNTGYLEEYTRELDKALRTFDENGWYQLIASDSIDGNLSAKLVRLPFDLLGSEYKFRRELMELEFNLRTLTYLLHSLLNDELQTSTNNEALNAFLGSDKLTGDKLRDLSDGIKSVFAVVRRVRSTGGGKEKGWLGKGADTAKAWYRGMTK